MSTSRVRYQVSTSPCPMKLVSRNASGYVQTWDSPDFSWEVVSEMSDQVTPGYFKAVRRGTVLPVNPMDQRKRTLLVTQGSAKWTHPDSRVVEFTGNLAASGWSSSNFPYTMEALLSNGGSVFPEPEFPSSYYLQRALAKARTSGWDVLTFAAEANKTWDLVARAARRTDRRASDIFRRISRPGNRRDLLRIFSEAWLEYRYGWRILAYDIESATEALEKLNQLRSKLLRRTEGEQVSTTGQQDVVRGSFCTPAIRAGLGPRYHFRAQWALETVLRAGVGLDLGIRSDVVFADPLVTAYEVIPYSFIMDWFFNTNDIVAAWSPFAVGDVAFAFVKTTKRRTITYEAHPLSVDGWTSDNTTSHVMVVTEERNLRAAASPTIDLRFRLNMNGAKLGDLLALYFARHARRMRALSRR